MQRVALPKTVLAGVILIAISFSYRAYGEVSAMFALGVNSYLMGQGIFLLALFGLHGWVLWKVVVGRNWARILLLVIVALWTIAGISVLQSPLTSELVSPAVIGAQVIVEVAGAVLLLLGGGYFEKRDAAA